jgi:hypothetical protein
MLEDSMQIIESPQGSIYYSGVLESGTNLDVLLSDIIGCNMREGREKFVKIKNKKRRDRELNPHPLNAQVMSRYLLAWA